MTEWQKLKGRITELEARVEDDRKAIGELQSRMVDLMGQMASRQCAEMTAIKRKPGRPRNDGRGTFSAG
jgi:hypothetical protein